MISHFYIHMTLGKSIDCRVIGWREVGVNAVTVERLVIDKREASEAYRDRLLEHHPTIYRELERKLGLPHYSLEYHNVII